MVELFGKKINFDSAGDELGWSTPLEGNTVPLEDIKEKDQPLIPSTLVGKIICSKILNKRVVKNILVKS